jgi:hypothetical protein
VTASALFAALFVPVLANPLVVLDHSARAEIRMRQPGDADLNGVEVDRSFDAEGTAAVGLGFSWRRNTLTFRYSPRYVISNFNHEDQSSEDLLHAFAISNTYRWPRVTLTLSQELQYGSRRYSGAATELPPILPDPIPGQPTPQPMPDPMTPAPTPGGSGQTVLQPTSVNYFSSESGLSSSIALSPRSTLTLSLSYFYGGGADDEARLRVPLTQGPRASAQWSYGLTRIDILTSTLQGQSIETETSGLLPSEQVRTVTATEGWARRWSLRTTSNVSGGLTYTQDSQAAEEHSIYPTAAASVTTTLWASGARRLDFTADTGVVVVIDRLTGQSDPRATAGARLSYVERNLLLYADGFWTKSLYPSRLNAVETHGAGVGLTYSFLEVFAFETGVRFVDQTITQPAGIAVSSAAEGRHWTAFAAISYTGVPIRL